MADNTTTPAQWAAGTTLGFRDVGSAGAFTIIAQLVEVDPKKIKRKVIKTLTLDTPAVAGQAPVEEKQAGAIETQPLKFKSIWRKADHPILVALAKSATPNREWQVTLSDGSTSTGVAFVSEINETPKASTDEVYMDEIELEPVSDWVYVAAA